MIGLLNRALARDFRVMPVYAPDAPVFLALALPVSEQASGLKPRLPAGRGMTAQQALISAGAEALELRASLAQSHASALAALPREDGFATVAARDLATGAEVRLPAQEVYLDCAATLAEPLLVDAGSTGCATGLTLDDAIATALWECIERDALALWWHGGLAPQPLRQDLLDGQRPRLGWWLQQRDRSTRLLHLESDLGPAVVAAVSADPTGRNLALGSAARPVLADAALAAITEMVQTEVAMDHAAAMGDPDCLAWRDGASLSDLPTTRSEVMGPFPPSATVGVPEVLRRLDDLGLRALAVELSLPGDPVPSVRVIVPGLCRMGGAPLPPRFRALCPGRTAPRFPEPF